MKIKKNDLFIGIYLLAAVLFFIISIPSWLLDILLAIPYDAVIYDYFQNFP